MKKKFNKGDNKKSPEELKQYLQFRRHGYVIAPKKGKGSFKRKSKYKNDYSLCA